MYPSVLELMEELQQQACAGLRKSALQALRAEEAVSM